MRKINRRFLVLIRHGEATGGSIESKLTAKGVKQAVWAGKILDKLKNSE